MSKVIEFPTGADVADDGVAVADDGVAVADDGVAVADDGVAEAETAEVIDITEEIAARAGIVTPRAALESVQAEVGEVVAVATVALMRDGSVATAFSTANPVTLLGMLEIAKDDVLYAGVIDDE